MKLKQATNIREGRILLYKFIDNEGKKHIQRIKVVEVFDAEVAKVRTLGGQESKNVWLTNLYETDTKPNVCRHGKTMPFSGCRRCKFAEFDGETGFCTLDYDNE